MHLDVFAPRVGAGNPLAVVLDAEGLDTDAMQRIAAWTKVIETTFVLPPTTPAASYRVRIFTPRRELAFAGHPSVGTAHAVLAAGRATPRVEADGRRVLVQECGAGLLPVRVAGDGAARSLFVQAPATQVLARRDAGDIGLHGLLGGRLSNAGAALIDGGRRWWVAELVDEAAVRGWLPDFEGIAALAAAHEAMGLTVFARCPRDRPIVGASGGNGYDLVVRALMPMGSGYEDPASGAANAALAGYLHATGQAADLGQHYVVSQGREVGRDARLELVHEAGRIWVGGRTQTVVDGALRW
ncbi:MAG TPA: PhzF family phenazine biosynthesis protein [Xanthomonadaceae bacterium]|jgi:PhzF family phenazine biosynthesis protein|nr:PhzF family phenazine biosynthesis protein [Xanthomonadaceae bacterium]